MSKSSQVGTTKIALNLDAHEMRDVFSRVGFGEYLGSGFPGESMGMLPSYRDWHPVTQATFAFGYGLSASPLQLARAYGVLANNGLKKDIKLLLDEGETNVSRVFSSDLSKTVNNMLESVVSESGTGKNAMTVSYTHLTLPTTCCV